MESLRRGSITQQRHTLHLSFISFLPGQEAHLPKVNNRKKEGRGGFYSPKEINVPDKCGFCPLGTQNANKYQIILIKTLHSVKLCAEFDNIRFFFFDNRLNIELTF